MTHGRVQFERTVCLMPVQEYRNGDDRDVGQNRGDDDASPPREVHYTGK
jgi:hypothetical protein